MGSPAERTVYVDFLAAPVVNSLQHLEPIEETDPLERLAACEQQVLGTIEAADFPIDLLPVYPADSFRNLSENVTSSSKAAEQAQSFIRAAFDDAGHIIGYAANFVSTRDLNIEDSLNALLKRSAPKLLSVAYLFLDQEAEILNLLGEGHKGPEEYQYITEVVGELLEISENGDGQKILDWNKEIRTRMKGHRWPNVGCPAAKKQIETANTKQSLLRFFWNRVVDVMYPPNEPGAAVDEPS